MESENHALGEGEVFIGGARFCCNTVGKQMIECFENSWGWGGGEKFNIASGDKRGYKRWKRSARA